MNPTTLTWRTSSYSGSNAGECVQIAFHADHVYIADSKYLRNPTNDPTQQPTIAIPTHDWPAFLATTTGTPAEPHRNLPTLQFHPTGHVTITTNTTTLTYTPTEWTAFTKGIHAGEFTPA